MKLVSKSDRKLKTWAALLGIVQGLVWIILSAVSIGFHFSKTRKDVVGFRTFMGAVEFFIYGLFITDDYDFHLIRIYNQTMTAELFNFASIAYLILNLLWVLVSFKVLSGSTLFRGPLKLWGTVTLLICALDLVVTIILGYDYHKCVNSSKTFFGNPVLDGAICANGILPVLCITAKGFVLWMVNFIFAVMLISTSPKKVLSSDFQQAPSYNPQANTVPQFQITPSSPAPVPHFPSSPNYDTSYQSRSSRQNRESPSPRSSRQWQVHSSNNRTNSRTRGSSSNNYASFIKEQNLGSKGYILSNQTKKPFVLHTPPRRF